MLALLAADRTGRGEIVPSCGLRAVRGDPRRSPASADPPPETQPEGHRPLSLRDVDHQSVRDYLAQLEAGPDAGDGADRTTRGIAHSSYFGTGGPSWGDGFKTRRPPSTREMTDAFRAVAFACARINANAVAKTPLKQYVTTTKGQAQPRCDRRPISKHQRGYLESVGFLTPELARSGVEVEEMIDSPIMRVLRRPTRTPDSPFKGVWSLLWFTQISMDIVGSAYHQVVRDGFGTVSELYPLSPRYVIPVPFAEPRADNRVISHYLDSWGETIKVEDIARYRWISLTNPYVSHYGPLEACFAELGVRDKFEATAGALFDNVFHPSAIISAKNPDRPIGEDVKPRLEADLKKHFTRAKAGGVVISDGSLQYDPWQQPQTDVGGLEVSREAKTTIANCFDVPMPLLEMTDSNLASAAAAETALAKCSTLPRCGQIAEQATGWLREVSERDPMKGQHGPTNWDRTFVAFDNPVPTDEANRTKVQVSLANIGAKTPNEIRRENGDEDVPWGDEPWIAGTLRQPSEPRPVPAAVGPDGKPKPEAKTDDEGEE